MPAPDKPQVQFLISLSLKYVNNWICLFMCLNLVVNLLALSVPEGFDADVGIVRGRQGDSHCL